MTEAALQQEIENAIAAYGRQMNAAQAAEWAGMSKTTWYNRRRNGEEMPTEHMPHRFRTVDVVAWFYDQDREHVENKLPVVDGWDDVLNRR